MGQAKQRGNYDMRKASAIEKRRAEDESAAKMQNARLSKKGFSVLAIAAAFGAVQP